jgi:hypothetical protein
MEFEDELTELFDHATATLRPPVDELLEQSSTRGRRLRRRRRTAGAALGTLGVAAVVCGTAVGVLHGHSPTRSAQVALGASPRSPAAAPTGAVTLSANPAKATTTPTATADGASSAPSGQTSSASGSSGTDYDLLKSLLPAGGSLEPLPYDWGGTVPGAADAVYNDGHGAVEISVSTTSRRSGVTCANWIGGMDEGPRPAGATPVSCVEVTLPDGDRRLTFVTGTDGSGFYDYEVTLTRTDGTVVMATVGNGVPEGATVDVTRAVPPLTLAQLQAIAANPGWHLG